jgi:hypothetical protein
MFPYPEVFEGVSALTSWQTFQQEERCAGIISDNNFITVMLSLV